MIKQPVYKLVNYLIHSDFFQEQFKYAFKDDFMNARDKISKEITCQPHDEYNLGVLPTNRGDKPAIFITARFRSGSTFLWNVFRHIEQCTAYYEPLNERKWFLETQSSSVDNTHLGVDNYVSEYLGLNHLEHLYKIDWNNENLYMDHTSYDPNLKKYIDILINEATGLPVLQFNRMDFRLPWLKAHYPNTKILHLYRHPRQQWMSVQYKNEKIPYNYNYQGSENLFLFYTIIWANDLKKHFPFLEPRQAKHPYEIYYSLWKLSYLFGKQYSDYSISYEALVSDFDRTVHAVLKKVDLNNIDISELKSLKQGNIKESWRSYASEKWFQDIEQECEDNINSFFKNN